MNGESNFCLNRLINKQNCQFWGKTNSKKMDPHQLTPVKCISWCRVMTSKVISPYFFKKEAETVNVAL